MDKIPSDDERYAQSDRIMQDTDPQTMMADVKGIAGTEERTVSSGREDIERFCIANGIDAEQMFASAFGYTLSRFTGSQE